MKARVNPAPGIPPAASRKRIQIQKKTEKRS
jgi:hypothetical protein